MNHDQITSRARRRFLRAIRNHYLNIQQQGEMNNAPAVAVEEFVLDPFKANLNPGKAEDKRLYLSASKELEEDKRIQLKNETAKDFRVMIEADASKFGWGRLINFITNIAGETLSIIKDIRSVKLEDVKNAALKTWNDATANRATVFPTIENMLVQDLTPTTDNAHKQAFYARVRSQMIAKRLLGSICSVTRKTLFNKRTHFSWTDGNGDAFYDGPTILYILLASVNPSTRVGVSKLKETIRNTRLEKFVFKIDDMISNMESNYNLIIERGHKHDDIVMDLFTALLSTKNTVFQDFIQRKKDQWEDGTDMTFDELAASALCKYNNMVEQRT